MDNNPETNILIVDDISSNIKILRNILKKTGARILEALSGRKAIDIARHDMPDLILLDIMMPEMDGFEVCRKIKASQETRHIPIMFVTARASVEDIVKGFELGAVDYITKPFRKDEVLARVKTQLSLSTTRKELRESKKKYSALISNMMDGIVLWTPAKGFSFSNEAFCKMLGYSQDEIISMNLPDIIVAEDLEKAETSFSGIYTGEKNNGTAECTCRMIRKNGELVYTSCLPSLTVINHTQAVLISVRDISYIIELEKEIGHAQKLEALGALTSGIAHDFNNILALINGYSELALYDVEEDSPAYEKLKIILDAGRGAVSLTKGLLSFGRKKTMLLEPMSLSAEVERVKSFILRGLPGNINLHTDCKNENINVLGDSGMIQQVLVNLCLNSKDAMPEGGDIHISLDTVRTEAPSSVNDKSASGIYASLSVRDTGSGIPDEIMDKIFDPFFSTKNQGKGSGLGLAMTHRIIKNHNGWINVESSAGKGSVFNIFLPVIPGSFVKGPKKETAYKHKYNPALNDILIVDDDEIQLSMIQYFLEKENYHVTTSNNPAYALNLIEAGPEKFKVVILDQIMPEIRGTECSKIIKERWPEIKIIIISGAGHIPPAGNKFMRKPFTVKDILTTLDTFR